MALITAEIQLPEVMRAVTTRLYFPTDLPEDVGNKVKGVITLLHGLGGSNNGWLTMTAACRYAADNGYALVVPDAHNSFYTDMHYGSPWYTIIAQLLPTQLHRIFRLPTAREKNFIAGLSMGGYGALRIGMLNPEKYAAIGSFSGVLDMAAMAKTGCGMPEIFPLLEPVLGSGMQVDESQNLFTLARKTAALPKKQQPRILCTCGRQDNDVAQVYAQNQSFRAAVKGLPLDFTYMEWDGVHEWNFWDRSLAEFIGFVQKNDYARRKQKDWGEESTKN